MTRYLIIAVLALLLLLTGQSILYKKAKEERNRHESNYLELQQFSASKIQQLTLTSKEFKAQMSDSTKKLLAELEIKPKKVIEYRTITVKDIDTVFVELPVIQEIDSTYSFIDTAGCFTVQGLVQTSFLSDPRVYITHKEYDNSTQYILFSQREKYKFLFWKWRLFGKKSTKLEIVPECGEVEYRTINIVK